MANRRNLKKQISYICGNIAGECVLAREYVEGIDKNKMNEIVIELAELQMHTLKNVTFSFDKIPSDFDNKKEYRKAAKRYFYKAYKVLTEQFNNKIYAIIKQMNEQLPAAQREANKKAAQR